MKTLEDMVWNACRVVEIIGQLLAVEPPERGKVISIRQVGGLHHRYVRAARRSGLCNELAHDLHTLGSPRLLKARLYLR